jgi:hypothetical protein
MSASKALIDRTFGRFLDRTDMQTDLALNNNWLPPLFPAQD